MSKLDNVINILYNRIISKGFENSQDDPNGGWDANAKIWRPHDSYEGDDQTIGYGIKLTPGSSQVVDNIIKRIKNFGGLTDDQAKAAVKSLLPKYIKQAANAYNKRFGKNAWDELSDESQAFLTDYEYNVKGGLATFQNLMDGFHSGDTSKMKKHYIRKGLKSRNQTMFNALNDIIYGNNIYRIKPQNQLYYPTANGSWLDDVSGTEEEYRNRVDAFFHNWLKSKNPDLYKRYVVDHVNNAVTTNAYQRARQKFLVKSGINNARAHYLGTVLDVPLNEISDDQLKRQGITRNTSVQQNSRTPISVNKSTSNIVRRQPISRQNTYKQQQLNLPDINYILQMPEIEPIDTTIPQQVPYGVMDEFASPTLPSVETPNISIKARDINTSMPDITPPDVNYETPIKVVGTSIQKPSNIQEKQQEQTPNSSNPVTNNYTNKTVQNTQKNISIPQRDVSNDIPQKSVTDVIPNRIVVNNVSGLNRKTKRLLKRKQKAENKKLNNPMTAYNSFIEELQRVNESIQGAEEDIRESQKY